MGNTWLRCNCKRACASNAEPVDKSCTLWQTELNEKAVAFAEKYGIEKVYNSIDELFEDENVDIIYISTPHNTHISYLRKALKAKKHVLCENQ